MRRAVRLSLAGLLVFTPLVLGVLYFLICPVAPEFDNIRSSELSRKVFGFRKRVLGWVVGGSGVQSVAISRAELAVFDGSSDLLPVWISIANQVFDVTAGRDFYRVGGSYNVFAGRDATFHLFDLSEASERTWCGEHEWAALSDEMRKSLDGWLDFFNTHKYYFRVGTLTNEDYAPCASAHEAQDAHLSLHNEHLLEAGPMPDPPANQQQHGHDEL
ncbi:Membrane steroid-binding protein 1 [Porphyridium purpureum]|uniref:Membrane steroid-binding protein 1 n=1 Tax=Porphyridium purpureum TaxID=35688 RepID=A0A5J4YTV5_PORPP|nr:Membrane steroid-binding protein 1 [Porphyridium purpureum]|eukprot:POR7730..scf227_4